MNSGMIVLSCLILASCAIENRSLSEDTGDPSGGSAVLGAISGSSSAGGGSTSSLAGGGGATGVNGGPPAAGTAGIGSGATGGGGQPNGTAGATSAVCAGVTFGFASDPQGWAVSYSEPNQLAGASKLSWLASSGYLSSGGLQLSVPFSGPNQKLEAAIDMPSADLRGVLLTAWVRLDSGLTNDLANPGGAKLYVKSGQQFAYADGGWFNLTTAWTRVQLRVDAPGGFVQSGYAPNDVRELGLELATGGMGTYQAAVISFDAVGCGS